ncbi:MAG: glycosyltransferase family 4 protein [Phycisphaeraceae bacterium]|nr:glycosyltransferase family 4 protein [Phycisphaeraceae bacterium]
MRALLIAEAANPEWTSVPLVGWSHARAIMRRVDAHLVTQVRNQEAFERAGVERASYTCIDSEAVARLTWKISSKLSGGAGKGWTTLMAASSVSYYYFEHLLWKQFGPRIRAGEFDVVHRITPLSPTIPSLLARRCQRAGVPFIVGPLNGGVPWPRAFDRERRREKEWLSYVRGMYRLLPGYGSMRRNAAAIVVGSKDTLKQEPARYHGKCVYIPENGIDPERFSKPVEGPIGTPVKGAFVGRLVPYKGADMLLEAAAPLIRAGKLTIDVIGDGPEMPRLRDQVNREGIESGVQLPGWVEHTKLQERLRHSDLLTFPSIREFGGGVVLEAMALGLVPVIVDYGGPAELITPQTGIAVPIGTRQQVIDNYRQALERIVGQPSMIRPMGMAARERVLGQFTWDAKAAQMVEVYREAVERVKRGSAGERIG